MGVATALTADRMIEIEQNSVVAGLVDVNGDLILEKRSGVQFNAGNVKGDRGPEGLDGAPAGAILAWPAIGIPTNWLECNGQAVNRIVYADLFAIIGSIYGDGDGVSTFNVPDLRGRVIHGLDINQTEFDTLTKSGGEKKHLLTKDELPSIRPEFQQRPIWYGNDIRSGTTGSIYSQTNTTTQFGKRLDTEPIQDFYALGNDVPHNILQPYKVAKYIIKASGGIGTINSTVESVLLGRTSSLENRATVLETDVAKLKEKLPAFKAVLTADHGRSGAAAWARIPFNKELLDTRDAYNPTLARFTAPVKGLYEFDGHVTPSSNSGGPALSFFVNGSLVSATHKAGVGQHLAYSNPYDGMHWSEMFELEVGDYVEAFLNNANGQSVTITAVYGSSFQGKLLQAY